MSWLTVGKLVLGNLDTIVGVARPLFTRTQADTLPSQVDILTRQVAELQAASSTNAEQIRELAEQLKRVVTALEQAGAIAAAEHARAWRVATIAMGTGIVALVLAIVALVR